MKDRKKPDKFLLPHGMSSDDRKFAFSSRVFPKAAQIKAPYKLWHYQLWKAWSSPIVSARASCSGRRKKSVSTRCRPTRGIILEAVLFRGVVPRGDVAGLLGID